MATKTRKRKAHLTYINDQNSKTWVVTYWPELKLVRFRRKHTAKLYEIPITEVFELAICQKLLPLQ